MSQSPGGFVDGDAWFHGPISRDSAEQLLLMQKQGNCLPSAAEDDELGDDGTFLVRESSTSVGDYAISVLSAGEVHHVQIKRHEGDAFFSIEGGPIIHGLDELIKHYQSSDSQDNEESILLTKPLLKSQPPPDCRRHGRTNLLHRATKEASVEIVMEMVRCGHRSLDAKNEDGQTAVHLAAMQGLNPILSILINAGTNVNAKDSRSFTPLHYACINNLPEAVTILLEEGNANPQIRRHDNGWVPLHEAAHRGHLECIKILWKHYAPLRPRTLDQKLPIHLAIEGDQEETISWFDKTRSRRTLSNRDDWYHGPLEREEALRMCQLCQNSNLKNDGPTISYFLIRRHSRKPNVFVLTMLYQGKSYRFEIGREHNFYFIDDGPYLDSLEHLVDHYSRWPDGLPTTLQVPVSPTNTFSQPPTLSRRNNSGTPDTLEIPPPLPKRAPLASSPNTFTRLCNDVANNNRPLPPFSRERIPHELIEIGNSLGGGEYGEVFNGRLTMGSSIMEVAVKSLKNEDQMNEWTKKEFLQEAKVMLELEHEHIVKIIGICWEPRVYMVQELMTHGSLQAYLVEHRNDVNPDKDFRLWAHQIAKGMVYLQRKKFVHRDLAARNILLNATRDAKISDFGLSRALGDNSDYYTASSGGRWPIKWYAPESCNLGNFSHASDVWSYGVTLWEIWEFGATPYGDETTGIKVIDMVGRGERLERPKHCPENVYAVMKRCWNTNPDLRPTFMFLENYFAAAETLSLSNSSTCTNSNSKPSTPTETETPSTTTLTTTTSTSAVLNPFQDDFSTTPLNNLNIESDSSNVNANNNFSSNLDTAHVLCHSIESLELIDFS